MLDLTVGGIWSQATGVGRRRQCHRTIIRLDCLQRRSSGPGHGNDRSGNARWQADKGTTINHRGNVVVVTARSQGDADIQGSSGRVRAACWIGTLGGRFSSAYAVNAAGLVVGSSGLATGGVAHAFAWTDSAGWWISGRFSNESIADRCERHRVIAGISYVADGCSNREYTSHAFVSIPGAG